jgi:selenocysteine-specific elongation factor
LLGVGSGVVALTKSDLVDPDELDLARLDVAEHLAGTRLEKAPIVAVSSVTGEGFDTLLSALDEVVSATPGPIDENRPRLWVDRVFTIAGAGTVVTGTSAGGTFHSGDDVEMLPGGVRARIRNIQTHQQDVTAARPGNRVALNLSGIERGDLERGQAVVRPRAWRVTDEVDVLLTNPDASVTGHGQTIREKGSYLLYAGTAETSVRVRLLEREELAPGGAAPARLYLATALPLGRNDRFVLRDSGRVLTVGGGRVLDPGPGVLPRARAGHAARLLGWAGLDGEGALAALVAEDDTVSVADAAYRSGCAAALDDEWVPPAGVVRLGDLLVSSRRQAELRAESERLLEAFHRVEPLEVGMPRERVRSLLGLEPEPFDALMATIDGLEQDGTAIRLGGHSVALDETQGSAAASLVKQLDGAAYKPPLASELGVERALLRALMNRGDIVAIGNFYLSAARADEARSRVRAEIERNGPQSVAQIRDLLGTSRKYAIPLCEWLDETGTTRRRGDLRELGVRS